MGAAVPSHTARGVALVVLVGALFGWLGVTTLPDAHVARAVMVIVTGDDEVTAARVLATQHALITNGAVLGPVAERARVPLEELTRTVDANLDPEESLLRVDVTSGTADRAEAIVADIVTEYLTVAFSTDFPVDGLVRVRLVLPPHVVVEQTPTPWGGTALGAAIGLGVALVTVAVIHVQGRDSR